MHPSLVLRRSPKPVPFRGDWSMATSQAVQLMTSEGRSTASLVHAARDGDRNAFAVLYDHHVRFVHTLLLGYAPPDDVPDLAQEVFLAAWLRIGTLRDAAAFPGWLGAIARNLGRMHVRVQRDHVSLTPDIRSRHVEPEDVLDAERALALINTLPETFREPLLLRLVDGMDGEEIAACLDMTHAAVRVNLHRGMKRLRELLESHHV